MLCASGQQYSFTFKLEGRTDTMMYIGQYYRDAVTLVDSAKSKNGTYVFKGNRKWERGMYALVGQDGKKAVSDFCIDGSLKFSISGDAKLKASTVKVKGCQVNSQMYEYLAVEEAAKKEMDSLRTLRKTDKEAAEAGEKARTERMLAYEAKAQHPKNANIFFELQNLCAPAELPDSVK